MADKSINVGGNITGTGIAVGHNIKITISQGERAELKSLLQQMQDQVRGAPIPEAAKTAILDEAVPELDRAIETDQPAVGVASGLGKINLILKGIGAAAQEVSGIADVAVKIAKIAGVAAGAAPLLLGLL